MDQQPQTPAKRVFALSEITGSIERMFEKYYESPYWIKAEISALNLYPTSGHCFPLMVEKSEGKIKAQIKATIWKEDLYYITQKFEKETKEKFREGLNIMFLAYVKFSSVYGLSLQIIDIEPLFTLGEMALNKYQTVVALKEEGIFDKNRTLPVPALIKRLAIISVESSKGYNDLMVTLRSNKQGYYIIARLFPAVMQGKGAVETITRQLRLIAALHTQYDAVAIIRGGGDDVGLSCYDDQTLAREVALFPIPVITGIGHSTNETVTEMVACINKITPTDVAHFILSGFAEQDKILQAATGYIINYSQYLLKEENDSLHDLLERLSSQTMQIFIQQSAELKSMAIELTSSALKNLMLNRLSLSRKEMDLNRQPVRIFEEGKRALLNLNRMLLFNAQHSLNSQKQLLSEREKIIRNLNPENVLKRGYAIVKVNSKIPDSFDIIQPGDQLEIETLAHKIKGKVEESVKRP